MATTQAFKPLLWRTAFFRPCTVGSVKAGFVVANADVIGQADVPDAEFSETLSHLSK